MKEGKTVHNHRTIMYSELKRVMDHGIEKDDYLNALTQNVFNKATKSGITYTSQFLKRLYNFDISLPIFKALKYFWNTANEHDRSLIAFLYAVGNDYLLNESIPIITNIPIGNKVSGASLIDNIESNYPQKYSVNTKGSMSRNIISSWKQAGFITGKVKNIRTQPEINYLVVTFALFLAYLNGLRGDFILKSDWVRALSLDERTVRSLAIEAGKRDLLQYQFAGNVTSITFKNLLNNLDINGIEN